MTDMEKLAARLAELAWSVMKDSPYSNWQYSELPPKAKARVDQTVSAVVRELAERQDWWISHVLAGIVAGGKSLERLPSYARLLGAVQGRLEAADELRGLADYIEKAG